VAQAQLFPEDCEDGPYKGYKRLHWIHSAAESRKDERCNVLMHHLNEHNLRRAFHELDGSKASGIDHVSKQEYEKELTSHLAKLADEIRRGGWRPKPSREVLIPKPQGGTRPLAIGCLEDKIVQVLVARILEALYEPHFHRHSFGFRRGKSAHQALARTYKVIVERRAKCVVVEMDIEKFFNSMSHDWLLEKLAQKIGDSHFLRLIRRMLRNSILSENGELVTSELGTPQGSPASPILANIYLHYLLDEWFRENWTGRGEMVRYADDAVYVFTDEQTAKAFQAALVTRMQEAGLHLNLDKSKVIPFDDQDPKGTVSLLGFEFYWGRNLKRQRVLKLKTAPKRLARCMQAFKEWIKRFRNRLPLAKLWDKASAKLQGHYNYFGLCFNSAKVSHFYITCTKLLFKWLNRRSQKRSFTWEKFERRLWFNPLPKPPRGEHLLDISASEFGSGWKPKPKSRMRKLRTSGSQRSIGRQRPVFT